MTEKSLLSKILRLRKTESLRAIGLKFSISHGAVQRIIENKKFPQNPEKRTKLGLSVLKLAEPCYICGNIHKSSCSKSSIMSFAERLRSSILSEKESKTIYQIYRYLKSYE